jgi:hypothetical protein
MHKLTVRMFYLLLISINSILNKLSLNIHREMVAII